MSFLFVSYFRTNIYYGDNYISRFFLKTPTKKFFLNFRVKTVFSDYIYMKILQKGEL